jgi:hypothetical protein
MVSLNKKCILECYREVQTRKNLLIDIIFAMKIVFECTFQSYPLETYVSTTQRCAVPLVYF